MLKKYGKWHARWTDATGKRLQKAFDTKKAARKHQDKMAQEREEKKARPTAQSAPSPKRGGSKRGPRRKARSPKK